MKKALVVDDTKNIRTLLTTCLEMNKYEVITAKDGEEALRFLNKALALKANDGQIYYLIAVCYKHMGKEEEAKKFYKAAQVFGYK